MKYIQFFLPLFIMFSITACSNTHSSGNQTNQDPFTTNKDVEVRFSTVGGGLEINLQITLLFKNPIDATSINGSSVFLQRVSDGANQVLQSFTPSEGNTSNITLEYTNLTYNTNYQLILTTSVKDANGNPLEKNYTYEFSTATTGATMRSYPTDTEQNVSIHTSIKLEFNTDMDLSKFSSDLVTITDLNNSANISYSVIKGPRHFLLTPTVPLSANTQYKVTINSMYDLAGVLSNNGAAVTNVFTTQSLAKFNEGYSDGSAVVAGSEFAVYQLTSPGPELFFINDTNLTALSLYGITYKEQNATLDFPPMDLARSADLLYVLENNASRYQLYEYNSSDITVAPALKDIDHNFSSIEMSDKIGCMVSNSNQLVTVYLLPSFSEGNITVTNPKQCILDDYWVRVLVLDDDNITSYTVNDVSNITSVSTINIPLVHDMIRDKDQLYVTHDNNISMYWDENFTLQATFDYSQPLGQMAIIGNYLLAEVNGTQQIAVFDISSSSNIVLLGKITTSAPIVTMKTVHLAYEGYSLQVGHSTAPFVEEYSLDTLSSMLFKKVHSYDIANKSNAPMVYTSGYHFIGTDRSIQIFADNNNSFYEFNLSAPVTSLNYDSSSYQLLVGLGTNGIQIYDINLSSTPNPLELNATTTNIGDVQDVVKSANMIFVSTLDQGLQLYDKNLNSIGNSTLASGYMKMTTDDENSFVYVATKDNTVEIYEHTTTSLDFNKSIDTNGTVIDLALDSSMGDLFVSLGFGGIDIYNIYNMYNFVKNIPTNGYATNLAYDDSAGLLYVADYTGVTTIPREGTGMSISFTSSPTKVLNVLVNYELNDTFTTDGLGDLTTFKEPLEAIGSGI